MRIELKPAATVATALLCAVTLIWTAPMLWMAVASFRPEIGGSIDMASLLPPRHPTLANFAEALESADFLRYYLNTTIVVHGILACQLVTITLAGYAFARLRCVTLPYLKPTTSFVAVIALINAITAVDHVIVLTKGGPNNATKLLLYYIYQNAHEFYDPGKATAATVISVAILLCLSMASLKTLERGASHAH